MVREPSEFVNSQYGMPALGHLWRGKLSRNDPTVDFAASGPIIFWQEACSLPGSEHLGVGKRLLERYEWWRMEPAPESVGPHWNPDDYLQPYAVVIPGQCRIVYFTTGSKGWWWQGVQVKGLEGAQGYRAFWLDPITGGEHDLGGVRPDGDGVWRAPLPPVFQD
ncbi:MAG: hypothetical protein QGI33_06620, partial [Candidatus Brocadiia bacterium]|nr:hypothetical protein [Candidatus Brocadiia bacterium]